MAWIPTIKERGLEALEIAQMDKQMDKIHHSNGFQVPTILEEKWTRHMSECRLLTKAGLKAIICSDASLCLPET